MIEMCMIRRNHELVVRMLQFGQLLCDSVRVMVVDKCDGADDHGIGNRGSLCDQAIANQVAKYLGAVGVSKLGNEIVEAPEKIGIERNSDSTENAHLSLHGR